ncbi:hypothetical protein LR013_00765, partial [candidate division NPL-UPA2 bacterium]|nr:hypothetical protein [candidate division NPL-UPA2 bacterium]
GLTIPCLNTFTTLQMRCLQGKEIREEYLRRQAKTAAPTGAAIPGITSEMENGIIPVNYQYIIKTFCKTFLDVIAEREE